MIKGIFEIKSILTAFDRPLKRIYSQSIGITIFKTILSVIGLVLVTEFYKFILFLIVYYTSLMKPVKFPRVKVCCMSSVEEALAAIELGASALGVVSKMPSGPGVIPDEMILEIVKVIPTGVASFLLTCEIKAEKIIEQQKMFKTNTLQLVDEIEVAEYEIIKKALPGIAIVQVVHVTDEKSIHYAMKVSKHVNAILLDSGNPNLKVKELGGTGKVHNWEISRKIREAVEIPVYLAGGLNAANVREAIEKVSPFGVDLCSGVRTDGKLDKIKLKDFFDKVYN